MGWRDAIAGFFVADFAQDNLRERGSCRIRGRREFRRARIMSELAKKSCVPCRGGVPPLAGKELEDLTGEVPAWKVVDGHHIVRTFTFPDFKQALAFVNRVGAIAEEQGHHPDILLGWGKAEITTWTHKINGLTESDFILAAKIDGI
jgi:4a-hydroxytetrahydrobiopterin dehydratase